MNNTYRAIQTGAHCWLIQKYKKRLGGYQWRNTGGVWITEQGAQEALDLLVNPKIIYPKQAPVA